MGLPETGVRRLGRILALGAALWACPLVSAAAEDPGWPREFKKNGRRMVMQQPQVDEWIGFTNLLFRSAISVRSALDTNEIFGVATVRVDTEVNRDSEMVLLKNPRVETQFPGLVSARLRSVKETVELLRPHYQSLVISLNRVLSYLDTNQVSLQPAISVNLDPPKIYYSKKPALMILFAGKPVFEPVPEAPLEYPKNCLNVVFWHPENRHYYLLTSIGWLRSEKLEAETWLPVDELPEAFQKLPAEPRWEQIRQAVAEQKKPIKQGVAPLVFVSFLPSELILTDGDPEMSPVGNTRLMQVTNADRIVFYHTGESRFYFLTTGRWFRAPKLAGPWTAATLDLPADFRQIPDDHPAGFVKTYVAGTPEAKDAFLKASVPKRITADREDAKMDVTYQGTPIFKPIAGTSVQYASNTSADVLTYDDRYYCCTQGIWFESKFATGPWELCDSVPPEIYQIPPESPKHHVTYVRPSTSSGESVTYTATGGYEGAYSVSGADVVALGLGVAATVAIIDHLHEEPVHVYYPSYHGPNDYTYRSYYHDPESGATGYGAYYRSAGEAGFAHRGYNPETDTYAARAGKTDGANTETRYYAERDDKTIHGGSESDAEGTVKWGESNTGGKAVGWENAESEGALAKDDEGNLYAGKDGHVYRKSENGSWSKYEDGEWQPHEPVSIETQGGRTHGVKQVNPQSPDASPSTKRAAPSPKSTRQLPGVSERATPPRNTVSRNGLDRAAASRSRGNRAAQRYSAMGRSRGGRGFRFQGGR